MAAVNCDDDNNKAFCGSMGVQGFPTLKIVKPKKKGGKPIVEDYQGVRTAKAIREALVDKMPNHVTKVTDKNMDDWLAKSNRPKAFFFSEKPAISQLVKSIAIEFLGSLDVAQVRSTEAQVVDRFGVEDFPRAFYMESAEHVPNQYTGEMKKDALVEFITTTGNLTPNPEFPSTTKAKAPNAKKEDKKAEKKDAKKETKSAAKSKETPPKECPASHNSETVENMENPHESPSPKADTEPPVKLPVETAPDLVSLNTEVTLQKACLNTRSGTCVLAVLSGGVEPDFSGLVHLREIAQKHVQRRMFPIYEVPDSNSATEKLLTILETGPPPPERVTLLAVNAKRGWWNRYSEPTMDLKSLENWIDNIKFGEFTKEKLPEALVLEVEVPEAGEENKEEAKEKPLKVEEIVEEAPRSRDEL